MLRTTVGLSFVLALASAIACSSKSTDDKGTGGNGAIVGGSGGTTANAAGTSTTGGTTGACAADSFACVDDIRASFCNPDTGAVETFSCVEEYAALGVISNGCATDVTGDACTVDDFSDQACVDGAAALAYCENATDEETFNVYVNCFQDYMDAHTIVPCFSKYVTPTMKTSDDCIMAEDACFGTGTGGTGSGGTGTGGTGTGGTGGSMAEAGAAQGGAP
jgi:hypothetical protein